jgi:hypothetical protein
VLISSHRKLLRSKAVVVSIAETPERDSGRQGRERRAQVNRCRSVESGLGDVKNRGVILPPERWLKAPVQMEDGSVVPRTAGTPQGGVISVGQLLVV